MQAKGLKRWQFYWFRWLGKTNSMIYGAAAQMPNIYEHIRQFVEQPQTLSEVFGGFEKVSDNEPDSQVIENHLNMN